MAEKNKAWAAAPKPKRLLMTADTVGGVWTYAIELAHALEEHGIEILLATMGAALNREQRKQIKTLNRVEVYESRFKLEWMDDPWLDVARAGNWLLEIEQRNQPDLIHLNNFAHGALPWTAPKIVVGHSCVLSWWKAVRNCPIAPLWNRYSNAVRKGLLSADLVVAPTRAMLQQLEFFYGSLRKKRVIYNGRNPELFHTRVKEEFIFSAGRLWDKAKNILTLGAVAPDVSWPIYVAGNEKNPNGGSVQRLKYICALGSLPPELLAHWLGRAWIYAAPALYEPFGLTILEAGLSGCALVLANIPSLREIWNGAALFVSPHDSAEWKFALNEVIKNSFRRKELAAHAQCRAIQLNPQRMAADYLSTYASVLTDAKCKREEVLCAS